jgi:hypothetical protein
MTRPHRTDNVGIVPFLSRRFKGAHFSAKSGTIGRMTPESRNDRGLGMNDVGKRFGIPPEVMEFVDSGFLELLGEDDAKKTVEFHMPSLRWEDENRRITAFSLTWIHPDFNATFCHYYHETPGDEPNFYVTKDTSESGDEILDLNDVDELVAWLDAKERP